VDFVKTAAAVVLSAAALIGGAAPAVAESLTPPYPTVTAWHDVNVRTCPYTSCASPYRILAGRGSIAYCWEHGQSITDFGITNDVWILTSRQDGGKLYASAVYFLGDEYANLPSTAECTY
jgi:hypothetical protein